MLVWDFETRRFGPSLLAPPPICLSLDDDDGNSLVVASCEPEFDDVLEHCLKAEMANSNIAFDMSVVLAQRPQFTDLVFNAYRQGRVHDILIREKLLTLATTGDLEYLELPNGSREKLKWGQGDLELRFLGVDRLAEKDEDDGWRANFEALEGMPAKEYPPEAFDYSLNDSKNGRRLFHDQADRAKKLPWDVFKPEALNCRASLALYLSSCWGFPVNHEEVERLFEQLSRRYHEHAVGEDGKPAYGNLLQLGILRPSTPARPYKKQEEKAIALLGKTPLDWEPHIEELISQGIKFTKPEKSTYNKKELAEQVRKVCEKFEIEVQMTDGGESGEKQVKFDKEVQTELAGLDVTLDEYIDRAEIQKLVTTELPRMRSGRVHPKYDILKKTGRTSSYGNSKKDKNPAYPAVNIQQIDPRVRHAYIASPGNVLCSIDYSAIELVSIAQKCVTLFGSSVLADKINAGMDPHAFLGAVLAQRLSDEFEGSQDRDENYRLFKALEGTSRNDFYLHFRGLAKPTGLGFPGGLGALRFIGFAKSTYKVDLVKIAGSEQAAIELAKELKKIWMETFPEMRDYFNWITRECRDVEWSSPDEDRYGYMSPHGMIRRNCRYTEATNGCALQTPTAEGAKLALWKLVEAMHDPDLKNTLLGCHMVAFIHDECIFELPLDDLTHTRAFEAVRLMVEGMKVVMPDVTVKAEPALMYVWDKKAKPVFDDQNQLIPWQAKAA